MGVRAATADPLPSAMHVVILAGGYGTRLAEETEVRPKPMVEIGHRPILWHIMKTYAHYGFNEFSIALGYKGEYIKRYFLDCAELEGSFTIDLQQRHVERHDCPTDNWRVHLVDTGVDTATGGRLHRVAHLLPAATFMMTYGDGVASINLAELVEFHRAHGKLVTVTAVHPPARFGALEFDGDYVSNFHEKPQAGEGWINGGFFVIEPAALDYIKHDDVFWEREPLERLAQDRQLVAYRHNAFWQSMDTLRDKRLLESLWQTGDAPWKVWRD